MKVNKRVVEKYQIGFQKMLEDKEAVYELMKVSGGYPKVIRELTWAYNYIQDAYALAYREMFDKSLKWKKKARKRKKVKITRGDEEKQAKMYSLSCSEKDFGRQRDFKGEHKVTDVPWD